MCTCSSLLKLFKRQIIFIFISLFMTISEGKIVCPFVETLSFGSDINVKCNSSYLIINEINSDRLHWVFTDESSKCDQDGPQQASVNQCGIRRIDSNYLTVPLKSLENNEQACVYCRINHKPIAPVIHAQLLEEDQHSYYTFNITATGLATNESFEILWAKRMHDEFQYSYNYWFLHECIASGVEIVSNTAHTLVFEVDDSGISRVEFILRRCNGTCRKYIKCDPQRFLKEIESISFQIPDSIEKISCDSNCLKGLTVNTSLPKMIRRPRQNFTITSTTTKSPFDPEQIIKCTVLVILIGIILSIILVLFIRYVICKSNGKKHVYVKSSNIDPDEHK